MTFTLGDFLRTPKVTFSDAEDMHNYGSFESERKVEGSSALVFRVGGGNYAINSKSVHAVTANLAINIVPYIGNRFCLGFVAFNGMAIPVADLRALLGLPKKDDSPDQNRFIIIQSQRLFTAIQAELVQGVCKLQVDPMPTEVGALSVAVGLNYSEPIALLSEQQITSQLKAALL